MPRLFILIKFEVFKPVVVLHTDLIGDVIVSTNKTVCFKIKKSRFKISLLDFFKPTKEPFTSCMNMGNWEEILFYSCLFLPQATFSVTSPHINVFFVVVFWFVKPSPTLRQTGTIVLVLFGLSLTRRESAKFCITNSSNPTLSRLSRKFHSVRCRIANSKQYQYCEQSWIVANSDQYVVNSHRFSLRLIWIRWNWFCGAVTLTDPT